MVVKGVAVIFRYSRGSRGLEASQLASGLVRRKRWMRTVIIRKIVIIGNIKK